MNTLQPNPSTVCNTYNTFREAVIATKSARAHSSFPNEQLVTN